MKVSVERRIKIVKDRVSAEEEILIENDNSGSSQMLFSLCVSRSPNEEATIENQSGKAPDTIKSLIILLIIQVIKSKGHNGSFIIFRERTRVSKQESSFAGKKGEIVT